MPLALYRGYFAKSGEEATAYLPASADRSPCPERCGIRELSLERGPLRLSGTMAGPTGFSSPFSRRLAELALERASERRRRSETGAFGHEFDRPIAVGE
jgi:hypothetical protein